MEIRRRTAPRNYLRSAQACATPAKASGTPPIRHRRRAVESAFSEISVVQRPDPLADLMTWLAQMEGYLCDLLQNRLRTRDSQALDFLFGPFAEPLLDHALIIQI